MRTRLAKVLAAVAVVVGLATPAAAGPAVPATGPCASVSVADVQQTDDTSPFVFTVSVNAPLGCAVQGSVDYHTADGAPGATAPEDYLGTAGTLTWSGDASPRTIAVPVVRDGPGEPNEQFWVQLDKPVGLTITGGAAVGGILGSVSGSTVTVDGSPKCWDVCTVGVHVTGPTWNGEQVHWQTVDNGGAGLGYVPVQDAVLSIKPNAPRGDITVQLDNPNQRIFQFKIRIFAPSFGVLGGSIALVTVTPNS
jgi:hypothetical protein